MLSEGIFYPYLVGSDVGCGMALFATNLSAAKSKPEKWAKKLNGLERPWDGDTAAWLQERWALDVFTASAGTIGLGNHFAELLRIKDVADEASFYPSGFDEKNLFLLVHSGSRGLGEMLLRSHVDLHRDGGLAAGSDEADRYLIRHDETMNWATANRGLIAHRVAEQLGGEYRLITDLAHNSITNVTINGKAAYLHRKGAAPSNQPLIVIPGSRGACSYLVKPTGDQSANLWSVAHGAGRKWNRSECEGRLRENYSADSMRKTRMGSYVICEDKDLLYEEAPQAYKDITGVIGDMVSFGLISVVAVFEPVLTYKVRQK